MKFILGISAFYHDSAAAIIADGKVIAAAQEERFSRIKHDERFPTAAISFCLDEAGLNLDDLDAVVFYDKPLLKFERLLETYLTFAPRGLSSFLKAIPFWLKEKLFLKRQIFQGLRQVSDFDRNRLTLLFTEHHLAHAASAYYPSPFSESAVLTIDGVGEWATATIGYAKGGEISIKKEMCFPHSVGLLYSSMTQFLGFKVNSGEYKVMGLAAYSNQDSERVLAFVSSIKSQILSIKEDGSIWLNQQYFDYPTGLKMIKSSHWEKLFEVKQRKSSEQLLQVHCDLAAAIQIVVEEVVLKMAREAKRITGSDNLVMAGGVALNCVANEKLAARGVFENIFIQPAAGDAGGAVGAALAAYFIFFKMDRKQNQCLSNGDLVYLGNTISENEIVKMARKHEAVFEKTKTIEQLSELVAGFIANGAAVGWCQGRMEFGPRALGNRSILADPRNEKTQHKLNKMVKGREDFRPFAPMILKEDIDRYFDSPADLRFMQYAVSIKEGGRFEVDETYNALSLSEKLKYIKGPFPAITHVDFTARVQTVSKEDNLESWTLLNAFKRNTDCPMLVNTSFNQSGEPIVSNAMDCYRTFMATDMDVLVLNQYVFVKQNQPNWENKKPWHVVFKPD